VSASPTETAVPAWLSDSEQRVWRRLLAAECRLRERLDRELQEAHGLSFGDYEVLVHLSEAEGASLRMSDLAERLLLSRSGLTRRVDGLVRAGWVERKACPDDGRGSLAVLTGAGLVQLEAAAPTHVRGVRRYLVDPLAESGGWEGLERGLSSVEQALASVEQALASVEQALDVSPQPEHESVRSGSGYDVAAPLDPAVGSADH
jgi:DNA-binding MarR family transcriptional regulator